VALVNACIKAALGLMAAGTKCPYPWESASLTATARTASKMPRGSRVLVVARRAWTEELRSLRERRAGEAACVAEVRRRRQAEVRRVKIFMAGRGWKIFTFFDFPPIMDMLLNVNV
jgi:hypothetical protein